MPKKVQFKKDTTVKKTLPAPSLSVSKSSIKKQTKVSKKEKFIQRKKKFLQSMEIHVYESLITFRSGAIGTK